MGADPNTPRLRACAAAAEDGVATGVIDLLPAEPLLPPELSPLLLASASALGLGLGLLLPPVEGINIPSYHRSPGDAA